MARVPLGPLANPFSPGFAKAHYFKFRIEQTPPPSLDRLRAGALALADPTSAGVVLRAAAADTLLEAYRRRFLSALPGIVNMRREHFRRADPRLDRDNLRRFLSAANKLDAAKLRGDAQAITQAKTTVENLRKRLQGNLRLGRRAKHPLAPSRGRFRRLAFRVLELVADINQSHSYATTGAVVLGIGDVAMLDQLRMPSATEHLTGTATTSRRNIVWRHLEFGTGAFATDQSAQYQRHRLPSGGWWYGKSRHEALHLRGSKPGKMLQDPARRLPYQPESLRFMAALHHLMTATLFGTQ